MKKHGFAQDGFYYIRHHSMALQKSARKIVALALSACMMATTLPAAVFAEGEIIAPEQTPVSVSAAETPIAPPAPETPIAPPAPETPIAPAASDSTAAETPIAPPAAETPIAPAASDSTAVETPIAPPAAAASDSTAVDSGAASSGSETIIPENEILTPTDSDATQQPLDPRTSAAEQTWNIGFPTDTGVTATLSADKTALKITGNGAMKDWDGSYNRAPWDADVATITNVTIDAGVTNIGAYALSGGKTLTSVTIPASVTTIGNHAFYYCTALASAVIPAGVTNIENNAFYHTALVTVTIPDSVTTMGYSAFEGCTALAAVTISAGMTSIEDSTFSGCTALKQITAPTIKTIGSHVFHGCTALTDVSFPAVKTILSYTFEDCTALTNASFPKITSMGGSAFNACTQLAAFTLPAAPPKVQDYAFANCTAARSISLVDADGAALTGTPLDAAQATYDAAEGANNDGMWYGWKVREPMTAPEAEWTPTGKNIACGSFDAALECMKATGGSIKLLTDLQPWTSAMMPAQAVTIDLNGKLWQTGGTINVPNGGTLTVHDSAGGGNIAAVLNAVAVKKGGTFALQSGSIVALDTGRYDGIFNEGTVKLSGGTVSSAKAYAVNNAGGTLYLSGAPTLRSEGLYANINHVSGAQIIASDGASAPAYFGGKASVNIAKANAGDVVVAGLQNADHAKKFTFTNTPATMETVYDDTAKSIKAVLRATVTSVTVAPATATVQKDGTQQFTVTVTGANSPAQTVTWAVTGGKAGTNINNDGLLTIAADETAASLTITATSTVDTTKSGTATVSLTKKVATLTINSVAAKTYDGTAISNPTDITSNVTSPKVAYTYYQDANGTKGTALSSAPKDAGTYWVEGAIAASDDYTAVTSAAVKFVIAKKDLSGASITINGIYTYNGNVQKPKNADVIVKDGTETISPDDYEIYTESRNILAGYGWIKVRFIHNYTGSALKDFIIEPATPTVTITLVSPNPSPFGNFWFKVKTGGVDNDQPKGHMTLSDNGILTNSFDVDKGTIMCTYQDFPVGAHTITAEFTAAERNYTDEAVTSSVKYTIVKADQSELTFDPGAKTYGDAAFTLDAKGGSGDGQFTYKSSNANIIAVNDTQATIHSAGTVTLTATKEGDDSHNEKTKDVVVTVKPATPVLVWDSAQAVTYTGKPAVITGPVITGVAGDMPRGNVTYSYQKGTSTTYTDGLPTQANTYGIKAKISASGNYTAAETTADLTLIVEEAKLTITGGTVAPEMWDNDTDATVTALTFDGLVNNETLTIGKDYSVGTPKFDSANVGAGKTVTGTASLLSTSRAGNYTLPDGKYSIPNCTIGKKPQITTIAEFVEQMYEKILGRSSDADGRKTWVDGLTNKTISGASCVYSFAFGAEYTSKNTSDDDFVTMLYAAFFGREPDTAGYQAWTKALENGMSREWVFAQFVSSPEFAATCKALGMEVGTYQTHDPRDENINATDFINRLYRTCLNRKGEKDGVNAWVNVLNKKTQSPKQIAHGFVFSKEFIAKNYSNTDYVKQLYRALMGREFDTAGLAAWVKTLDTGTMTREQVFNGFVNSPEFAAIIRSFGL